MTVETWNVRRLRMPEGDWGVFVNGQLEERGLSEHQAAHIVMCWVPPEEEVHDDDRTE